jgi:GAF domain-containing protein
VNDRVESVRLTEAQVALRRVATLVAQGASPAEVFEAVVTEIGRQIPGANAAALSRYEPDDTLTMIGKWSLSEGYVPVGARYPLVSGTVGSLIAETRQPARVDVDAEGLASLPEVIRDLGWLSVVGAPILVEGRLWGLVGISSTTELSLPADTEACLVEFTELVATAIANAESREALTLLAEEQAALRRVATLVASEPSQAEVFAAIAEEIGRLVGAQAIRMLRYEAGETALVVATWGVDGDVFPQVGFRAKLGGDNATSRVYVTGKSVRIDNYQDASGPIGEAVKAVSPLRSSVATPILVEGQTWGVVIAGTSSAEPMPPITERRLTQFSDLVATAIANAESRDALAVLADEQAALRRVATLVAQDVRRSEIFAAVAEEVAGLFETTGSVFRFEEGGKAAVIVGIANVDIPLGTRLEFEEGMGMIEVYRTGRPARVDHINVDRSNWSADEGSVVAAAGHLGLVSSVVSPIIVEGGTWGVIGIASTDEPLPLDTESRLEKFTELVATAIANAESREALSRLAAEQAALRRVATLVAGQASPDEIYAAVVEEVARLLLADRGAVVRYEPDDTLTVTAYWSTDGTDVPIGTRIPLAGDVVTATVRETGRPIRIDTYEELSGPIVDYARTVGPLPPSTVAAPIFVEGRAWGTIFVSTMKADPLPDDAESRVMLFTELLATAIANAENRSELAASRKRLVAASDEARRQIERDLHDGTQQRLVSLALAARAAGAELPTENGDVREKFSNIAKGLGEAVEDLQELSRGIHPAILSDAGLGPALETLALRSPIPVELEVATRERFPEPVEVATYFVASESLANAAKYSQASRITVRLALENEQLRLAIHDDGIGGADPGRGSGLIGLRDRVEALEGTIAIQSSSSTGTTVSTTLPVPDLPETTDTTTTTTTTTDPYPPYP